MTAIIYWRSSTKCHGWMFWRTKFYLGLPSLCFLPPFLKTGRKLENTLFKLLLVLCFRQGCTFKTKDALAGLRLLPPLPRPPQELVTTLAQRRTHFFTLLNQLLLPSTSTPIYHLRGPLCSSRHDRRATTSHQETRTSQHRRTTTTTTIHWTNHKNHQQRHRLLKTFQLSKCAETISVPGMKPGVQTLPRH